jgi:hypothetical protein
MRQGGYFWPEDYWQEPVIKRPAYVSPYQVEQAGSALEGGIAAAHRRRVVAPVDPWCSDAYLCTLAQDRAEWCLEWVRAQTRVITLDAINALLESLEAKPLKFSGDYSQEQQIQGFIKRIACELFWRRQLRRAQVRKREAQAQAAGHISARTMPYCHDVTAARYAARQEANRVMMEGTELENAAGDVVTLWQAAQASTANKSIRRGELMTRIRGCEEWATDAGMVGLFTTNTLPSRFHSSLFGGGKNPNYDGSTARDGQGWLSKTWARARAKIARQGIKVFGFRVAEPHHDGTPHWHMLLWVPKDQATALQAMLRAAWLQHEGDEYGAQEYRFKAEPIDPAKGGAIAYVAKYISKNIDDAGAVQFEGHFDQQGEQRELIAGTNKARRITAWASAWGIRQFQAIGQPPVTVWRELRRIDAAMVAGASKRLQRAHAAVHKTEDKKADWRAYMDEQGGAMVGRGYALRLEVDTSEKEGRYGLQTVARPAGVWDVARPGEVCTSMRAEWRARGTWSEADRRIATIGSFAAVAAECLYSVPTWTRFNNCTQEPREQRERIEKTGPRLAWKPMEGPDFAPRLSP